MSNWSPIWKSAWGSIWSGIWAVAGALFGFSIYSNGTSIKKVDFEKFGPVSANGDTMVGSFTTVDLDSNWLLKTRVKFEAGLTGSHFILTTLDTLSSRLELWFNADQNRIYAIIRDNASITQVFINVIISTKLGQYIDINFQRTGSSVTLTVADLTPATDASVDLTTNGCTIDAVSVLSQGGGSRATGLFCNLSLNILDSWNFLSNQDSGLFYRGLNGTILTLTEDVTGNSQYPYNGTISLAESEILTLPATGPVKMDSTSPVDLLKSTSIGYNPAKDDNFYITSIIDPATPNNDSAFIIYDSANPTTRFISGIYQPTENRWRIIAASALTTAVISNYDAALDVGNRHRYGFRIDSASNSIYATIDGVDTADVETVDFTGTTFDTIMIGTDLSEVTDAEILLYNCDSDQLGFTNFNTRLWPQSDPDTNKFYSDKGVIYILTDASPKNAVFPYYDNATGQWYYVDDILNEENTLDFVQRGKDNFLVKDTRAWVAGEGEATMPIVNIEDEPRKWGGVEFTGDTDTATLGFKDFYDFTETGTERTLTLSSADIAKGSPAVPWCPEILDVGGDCGSFNLIIASEGGELFDGAAGPITITVDRGRALLRINGTEIFTR